MPKISNFGDGINHPQMIDLANWVSHISCFLPLKSTHSKLRNWDLSCLGYSILFKEDSNYSWISHISHITESEEIFHTRSPHNVCRFPENPSTGARKSMLLRRLSRASSQADVFYKRTGYVSSNWTFPEQKALKYVEIMICHQLLMNCDCQGLSLQLLWRGHHFPPAKILDCSKAFSAVPKWIAEIRDGTPKWPGIQ